MMSCTVSSKPLNDFRRVMTDKREETYNKAEECSGYGLCERMLLLTFCLLMLFPFGYFTPAARAVNLATSQLPADSVENSGTVYLDGMVAIPVKEDSMAEPVDTIPPTEVRADDYAYDENGKIPFNPSPTRAVWLSVLCRDWVRYITAAIGNSP